MAFSSYPQETAALQQKLPASPPNKAISIGRRDIPAADNIVSVALVTGHLLASPVALVCSYSKGIINLRECSPTLSTLSGFLRLKLRHVYCQLPDILSKSTSENAFKERLGQTYKH
eukprot:scaffold87790_cov19-Tisochrysis_lutea.AAC.1